jgi:hypothetical protein
MLRAQKIQTRAILATSQAGITTRGTTRQLAADYIVSVTPLEFVLENAARRLEQLNQEKMAKLRKSEMKSPQNPLFFCC